MPAPMRHPARHDAFADRPPGHSRRIGRGDFASKAEADTAIDVYKRHGWGAYIEYGTGRGPEKEAGQ
jgi:hypothetical protein